MSEPSEKLKVTVIVPIRNEADFIESCLRSILASDYPRDRIEVLVVDGMSDDGTRDIVRRLAAADTRLRLLDNPERIVPHAMNRGIRESKGDLVLRIDGHAVVPPDFLAHNVAAMQEHPEAWGVGGSIDTVCSNYVGRAISAAMTSPVGVGNARFRLGGFQGYVDTIPFPCYRRWVFDRIGLFDEELVRNQDDEFNLRLTLAGGKLWMDSRIRSSYFSRGSLRKLARQYFQYGFWRIRTIQKHRRPATLRQLAPMGFVGTWLALLIGTAAWRPIGYALAAFAGLYMLGLLAGAADVARKVGLRYALVAPLAFMAMHFCYGLGSFQGLVVFGLMRWRLARPEDHPMSR
jgi:succinoglycan biosynthesis protein ExoA